MIKDKMAAKMAAVGGISIALVFDFAISRKVLGLERSAIHISKIKKTKIQYMSFIL